MKISITGNLLPAAYALALLPIDWEPRPHLPFLLLSSSLPTRFNLLSRRVKRNLTDEKQHNARDSDNAKRQCDLGRGESVERTRCASNRRSIDMKFDTEISDWLGYLFAGSTHGYYGMRLSTRY